MTKMQIVNRYYEILEQARQELDPRLDKLLKEKKITSGARYYVYDKYHWFGTQKISITLEKAAKSKKLQSLYQQDKLIQLALPHSRHGKTLQRSPRLRRTTRSSTV